jgi:hypothetical protein
MSSGFTKEDVLNYLDDCAANPGGFFLMDLEHGNFHTANSRLSLFADETRWAIVFEKSGFNKRGYRIELELNYFGNCLRNLYTPDSQHFYNSKYFSLVDDVDLEEIDADFEEVAPSATQVRVRDQYVPIPSRKEEYQKWIPDILTRDYPDFVSFQDLARYLAFEYEDLCRATLEELKTCLPDDLPFLMRIDEWHHRNAYAGEKPSSYETFPLIAEVLFSRDPTRYRPTLPPTNHWRNWPMAGNL